MSNEIKIYQEPKGGLQLPLDMTEIYRYQAMLEELPHVNSITGPLYMREFAAAADMASSFYSRITLDRDQAANKVKEEQALAYLERSEDYIKAKGLKSTDETKKQYVQIDPNYKKAKDILDVLNAIMTLLESKMKRFQDAHDDAKKIFDKSADSRGSTPAMPSSKDAG